MFNHPQERSAGDVIQNLKDCLKKMNITYEPDFDFKLLQDRLTADTISIG